jgi:hypothetical protein
MKVIKKYRFKRTTPLNKQIDLIGINIDRFLMNREMRQQKYRSSK